MLSKENWLHVILCLGLVWCGVVFSLAWDSRTTCLSEFDNITLSTRLRESPTSMATVLGSWMVLGFAVQKRNVSRLCSVTSHLGEGTLDWSRRAMGKWQGVWVSLEAKDQNRSNLWSYENFKGNAYSLWLTTVIRLFVLLQRDIVPPQSKIIIQDSCLG